MKLDILLTVDWDYYQRFMRVNLDGALLCARACWPAMKERGGGSIVNQSSTASWMYAGYYGLAKVGINGLTQQLARELGSSGIRINAIAPGPIDTDATKDTVPPAILEQIVKALPLPRLGTPDDLVGLCLFLLSDEASWITGQIFNVDGGQVFRSGARPGASGLGRWAHRWLRTFSIGPMGSSYATCARTRQSRSHQKGQKRLRFPAMSQRPATSSPSWFWTTSRFGMSFSVREASHPQAGRVPSSRSTPRSAPELRSA